MKTYSEFVSSFSKLVTEGRSLSLGGLPSLPKPNVPADAPKVLFFAPHPDDETIQGGLALRLMREAKWSVTNVSVTLGRIQDRKAGRLAELKNACDYLGFGLTQLSPNGLDAVTAATRAKDPAGWAKMVESAVKVLKEYKPKVIFFPHELDWNGTHIGVHFLVLDALKQVPDQTIYLVETEFWGQMQTPNLLVEYTPENVAELVAATSFHVGEVQRNPYHLLLPAWMQDNVRRGSELVGGQGEAAAQFMFAQVYRLRKWSGGKVEECQTKGKFLPIGTSAATLFPLDP